MSNVLVINPNSNTEVTAGIDAALEPLRVGGASIRSINLEGTPIGIQTQADVEEAGLAVARYITSYQDDHDSFVIACFSDPGLHMSRELSSKPVFGIAQTGLLSALSLGQKPGVISILAASIPRHWRFYRSMGIEAVIAGDVAVNTPVSELAEGERVLERMQAAGRTLRDEHGADVIVFGCAGMARYRPSLEAELGLPVVDPTQATAAFALSAVSLKYRTK